MEPLSALNLIERFEEYMFLMYDSWARAFSSDPWAAALFTRMKQEELAHRTMVQKQRNIVLESGGFAGQKIKLDIMEMNRIMTVISDATTSPPRDVKSALGISYSIESSAAEQYAFTALKEISPDLRDMLDDYTDKFGDHFSNLLDAIRKKRLKPVSPQHIELVQLRVPYSATVTVRDSLKAKGCNISDGGLFIATSDLFEEGQTVPLSIPLPGGAIRTEGLVKHVQLGKGVGFKLMGLTKEQSSAISDYIDRISGGEKVLIPESVPEPEVETKVPEPSSSEAALGAHLQRVIIVNNAVFSDYDLQGFISYLKDAGMDVQVIRGQSQALEMLAEEDVTVRSVIVAAETINDDGFSVLGAIRRDPAFAHLPLMVLSTSYDKKFINRVMAYGASFAHKLSLTPDALLTFVSQ